MYVLKLVKPISLFPGSDIENPKGTGELWAAFYVEPDLEWYVTSPIPWVPKEQPKVFKIYGHPWTMKAPLGT